MKRILTPQQKQHLPRVQGYLSEQTPDGLLLIEGFSGVGKSTLVRAAAELAGIDFDSLRSLDCGAYGRDNRHKALDNDGRIPVIDSQTPGTVERLLENYGERAKAVILLRPRADKDSKERIDHETDFREKGLTIADKLELGLMGPDEALAFGTTLNPDLSDNRLFKALEIGLADQVVRLATAVDGDPDLATFIGRAAVRNIVTSFYQLPADHIIDFHTYAAMFEQVAGRSFPRIPEIYNEKLEVLVGRLVKYLKFPFPQRRFTKDIYEKTLLGRQDGHRIAIHVPDISDEDLQKLRESLGMNHRGFFDRITGGAKAAYIFGENQHGLDIVVAENLWRIAKRNGYMSDEKVKGLMFLVRKHGGSSRYIDNPISAYVLECYLQGAGIPYYVEHENRILRIDDDGVETVDEEDYSFSNTGIRVRKVVEELPPL